MDPEKKSNGALVGLVVIIIILIIGGIYIWQSNKKATEKVQNQIEAVTTQDATDLNTIDADLQTTDTNVGVDANTLK
jgi:uncharacterized protein YpmB